MMSPPDPDSDGPYPNVRGALMLTLMALIAAGFTGIAFIDFGLLAAVGIGQAIGVGAVATLGAQRVAQPQAPRLGLRALDLDAIPMILCLVPAILLASEFDNFAAEWSAGSQPGAVEVLIDAQQSQLNDLLAGEDAKTEAYDVIADGASEDFAAADEVAETSDGEEEPLRLIDPDDPASVLQAFIVFVGISPLVEEFLFRGVIQQGLLQRLGLLRGVSMVALLWTLLRPAPIGGFSRFLAAAVASFALGWALGLVRIATGSILGPMLLASSWAAVGLSATVLEGKFPIPGLNVEGTHLPVMVTLASLGVVAWAGLAMYRQAQEKFGQDFGDGPNDPKRPTTVEDLSGDR
jgi:membrane protease YdiL (CAAX protease family)